jgi:large subunit ribosomal protein L6
MVKQTVENSVELPEGFTAEASGTSIVVKGKGGEASRQFKAIGITLKQENGSVVVVGRPASKKMNALVNTVASHIRNMVEGLQAKYSYRLSIVYSHFPMNVSVKGNVVEINNFVGEKKARAAKILPGVEVSVKGKDVFVKGHDKYATGQTAANLEAATKVRDKDRRIYQDGIFIVEKAVVEKKEGS